MLSIPGHIMKFLLLIAFWKVEITGDPAQACKYFVSSNLDFFMYYKIYRILMICYYGC